MGDRSGDLSTLAVYRRARQGEREFVERLLTRIRPRLESWVAARLGPSLRTLLDVDDVVQDILLKAYQNLHELRLDERRAFHKWLFTIARRTIIDWQARFHRDKRDVRRNEVLHSRMAGEDPTPSQVAARSEEHERLLLALAGLRERYRYVITLRRFENLSNADAAERLDITPENASLLLTRATRALRVAVDRLTEREDREPVDE